MRINLDEHGNDSDGTDHANEITENLTCVGARIRCLCKHIIRLRPLSDCQEMKSENAEALDKEIEK